VCAIPWDVISRSGVVKIHELLHSCFTLYFYLVKALATWISFVCNFIPNALCFLHNHFYRRLQNRQLSVLMPRHISCVPQTAVCTAAD